MPVYKFSQPLNWRSGYSLFKRFNVYDSDGNPQPSYNSTPDVVVSDTSEHAVCWQPVARRDNSAQFDNSTISHGACVEMYGEMLRSGLQGTLFSDLEVNLFDRFLINNQWWELRCIQIWNSFKLLQLQSLS